MASGHSRHQQHSREKEPSAELSSDRSPQLQQQGNGEEELQQKRINKREEAFQERFVTENYNIEEEERGAEAPPQRESSKKQQELFTTQMELKAEDSLRHLHSQPKRGNVTFSSPFMKDQEAISVLSTPVNADLLTSVDTNETFSSFPSKQVEGVLQSCLSSAESQVTRLLQQAMDTVQSQVLRALQQAAGDIIEHLGKDAAHRVVVAERKTALIELELSSVKQQALSMLLRLKADSDAQALDADKKYLLERRRAQDAEAKLAIAQDTSKRLRTELKRKGDILDKMQKLVQPMAEDHLQKPTRLMEESNRLDYCSRGITTDQTRTSPAHSMEDASFLVCNGTLQQELQGMALQPNTGPAVHMVHNLDKKQTSFSSETPAVEEDSLESRKQTYFSLGTPQGSQCTLGGLHQGDMTPAKIDEEREASLGTAKIDLSGPLEESYMGKLLESCSEREEGQVGHIHDTEHPPDKEYLDEKAVHIQPDNQANIADKDSDSFQASQAIVKGFYVRRKVRENGKLLEKKGTNMTAEVPVPYAVPDHNVKEESFVTSSCDAVSKSTADKQETEPQITDAQIFTQGLVDAMHFSDLLGHPPPVSCSSMVEAHSQNLRDDPVEEEKSSSENSKHFQLCSTSFRDELHVETGEFARPDYEVATSLAELAAIGLEVRSQHRAAPIARHEEVFIRPGKTGLRMKRRGVSFDKNISTHSEGKGNKKPRPDKLDTGLADCQTDRAPRRNRGTKFSISKDIFSLESSRDNRRLMQGARQLLCLAEKKWR